MISAVVINWNGRHYLETCLRSLLTQEPRPAEVIVVDNHSDDGSQEFVAAKFPEVKIVDTGFNAGPGYARNMGVEFASSERVLLVDNDVALTDGALASLAVTMDRTDAALVQARSVCGDDPDTVHYDGSDIHFLGLLVLHNWFRPLAEAQPPDGPNGGLVGLCVLADRRRFLDCGGFNPDLFFFFEDTEFGWRMRLRGEQIYLDPEAIVRHGAGTKELSMRGVGADYPSRRVYYHSRNRWLVLLTCLHWRSLLVLLIPQLAYDCVQFVFACVKRHPIAWFRGKLGVLRLLPRVWTWRRLAQESRRVRDRDLLVGGAFTLNPGLDRGLGGVLHACMAGCSTLWWNTLGRLCG